MQTYWLVVGQPARTSSTGEMASRRASQELVRPIEQISKRIVDNRMQRLVGWNVDVLKRLLRQVLAMREPHQIPSELASIIGDGEGTQKTDDFSDSSGANSLDGFEMADTSDRSAGYGTSVLEEVKDIIQLPSEPVDSKIDPYQIELSPEIVEQLTDFVTAIAQMYHENPFHNFEVRLSKVFRVLFHRLQRYLTESHRFSSFTACQPCHNECVQATVPCCHPTVYRSGSGRSVDSRRSGTPQIHLWHHFGSDLSVRLCSLRVDP